MTESQLTPGSPGSLDAVTAALVQDGGHVEVQPWQMEEDYGGDGKGGTWRMIVRAFAENKMALLGLILVIAIVLFCFIGPLIYHTDQVHSTLNTNLSPNSHSAPTRFLFSPMTLSG